ncbi:MAG: hypothetical protein V2B18_04900, partial [Pseudomonadota bacterium]
SAMRIAPWLVCCASSDDAGVTDRTLPELVTDWEMFLQAAESGPMKKLRQATRTGRPGGGGSFVTTVKRLTGRDLSKGRL